LFSFYFTFPPPYFNSILITYRLNDLVQQST
jgi:hypothetical protein